MTTKRPMTVFEKHRLKIAEATLRMPKEILGVMGGMTKEEAKEILRRRAIAAGHKLLGRKIKL